MPLHLSYRRVDGYLSTVQFRRDKEGSGQVHEVPTLRGALPNADQYPRPSLGKVQRPRVHIVHGMRGRLSTRLAQSEVPLILLPLLGRVLVEPNFAVPSTEVVCFV